VRRDALWMALVPMGLIAYAVFLGIDIGDPLRFGVAQGFWHREVGHLGPVPLGPIAAILQGFGSAVVGVWKLLFESASNPFWSLHGGSSLQRAGMNVETFAFLAIALAATVGALRRLPFAYGAYAVTTLALPLTFPATGNPGYAVPLFSLPRFVAVIFPLFMWAAVYLRERRWGRPALVVSALFLGLYSAQYATWQWVS
jgi:hypothetical protein